MQALNNILVENKGLMIGAAAVAFFVAAVLILLVFRLAFGRRLRMPGGGRARQMRLGIVDAFDLDRQRQLVIVRRDNIEHLVMIGGPNDILIESQISRADARRDVDTRRDKEVREKEPSYAASPKQHAEPKLGIPPSMPEPHPIAASEEHAEHPRATSMHAPGPSVPQPSVGGARRAGAAPGKLPSVHEGPATGHGEPLAAPQHKQPAIAAPVAEPAQSAAFLRWSNRPAPTPPQPPRPLKRPVTGPAAASRPRPVAAPETPAAAWPPVPTMEGLESLEEEMAKLLGRDPSKS
jgi:hypothetical protein